MAKVGQLESVEERQKAVQGTAVASQSKLDALACSKDVKAVALPSWDLRQLGVDSKLPEEVGVDRASSN